MNPAIFNLFLKYINASIDLKITQSKGFIDHAGIEYVKSLHRQLEQALEDERCGS